MATIKSYPVVGMTCGHCVTAVTTELQSLDGVTAVNVDLHPSAVSLVAVTSESELPYQSVAAAIQEAGYALEDSTTTSQEPHDKEGGCCGGAGSPSAGGNRERTKAGSGCCRDS